MPILTNVNNKIVIVEISEPLSHQDFATARLLLDKHIVSGLKEVLFDLSQFKSKNKEHLRLFADILSFCKSREAKFSTCGLANEIWTDPYLLPFTQYPRFEDRDLALAEERSAEASVKTPDSDTQQIQNVLAGYEKNRKSNSYDPLGLEKTLKTYQTSPSKKEIRALETAVLEYKKLKASNEALNHECSYLAEEMMKLTILRKGAIHEEEINQRKKELSLLLRIAEIDKEISN